VYAVSYVKLFVTLVKYMPQILTNYFNRSTYGWSIYQILLDLAGSVLSLAQLGIDSYLQHDWSGVTGNPVKFGLGNTAIGFDLVFIVQHYWIYRGVRGIALAESEVGDEGEEDPLLGSG
jgi:cystinosin